MSSKWKEALDNAASEEWTDVARTVRERALREIELEQLDENGLAVARRITDLADAIVTSAYEQSTHSSDPKPHALVALGGFGRREMAPTLISICSFYSRRRGQVAGVYLRCAASAVGFGV